MLKIFFLLLLSTNSWSSQNELVKSIFKKSSRYEIWEIKKREISAGKKTQLSWLPLNLESSIYRTNTLYGDKKETSLSSGPVLDFSDILAVNLRYNDFSSFSNVFSAKYNSNTYDTDYSTFGYAKSYDLSNKLEFNFTNFGNNSDLRIDQGLQLVNLSLSELEAIRNMNADYLDFFQKLLAYNLAVCKLDDQKKLMAIVEMTLKKGRALLSINAISRKDFLNFENIQINLERNIVTLENDLLQAKFDVESLGINIDKDIEKGSFASICNISSPSRYSYNISDFTKNIDYQILLKKINLNLLQLKQTKRNLVSDIKPFVEVGYNATLGKQSKDYRVVAGLSVGWDIPNQRQRSDVDFRSLGANYTTGDFQLTKRKIEFDAFGLNQDLKFLTQSMELTKRNLKSNENLIQILELENSLRRGDSLNFVNAVTNRASLINDFFDQKLRFETKLSQLALLEDGNYLVK